VPCFDTKEDAARPQTVSLIAGNRDHQRNNAQNQVRQPNPEQTFMFVLPCDYLSGCLDPAVLRLPHRILYLLNNVLDTCHKNSIDHRTPALADKVAQIIKISGFSQPTEKEYVRLIVDALFWEAKHEKEFRFAE